jgi:protein TonB
MSFIDQDRSREKALSGAVTIAVVGCVGYALISGLAMSVVRTPPWEIHATTYRAPPPPPPLRPKPTAKASKPAPSAPIVTPIQQIKTPAVDRTDVQTGTILPPPAHIQTGDLGTTMPPPPKSDLSAGARPQGHPGDWVTTDDYPASALRAGVEGRTGFRLDLGIDGHATGCTVTQSSGSDELDRTACRLLQRRAHFAPALGVDGQPIASSFAGSVIWRAPSD